MKSLIFIMIFLCVSLFHVLCYAQSGYVSAECPVSAIEGERVEVVVYPVVFESGGMSISSPVDDRSALVTAGVVQSLVLDSICIGHVAGMSFSYSQNVSFSDVLCRQKTGVDGVTDVLAYNVLMGLAGVLCAYIIWYSIQAAYLN